jgi:hypothetical protein
MKKKYKPMIKKFLAPFLLVFGLILGFFADRMLGSSSGSESKKLETEHSDAFLLAPPAAAPAAPLMSAPAKPSLAKILKTKKHRSAKACPSPKHAKASLAKAKSKSKKKKVQKVALAK